MTWIILAIMLDSGLKFQSLSEYTTKEKCEVSIPSVYKQFSKITCVQKGK